MEVLVGVFVNVVMVMTVIVEVVLIVNVLSDPNAQDLWTLNLADRCRGVVPVWDFHWNK